MIYQDTHKKHILCRSWDDLIHNQRQRSPARSIGYKIINIHHCRLDKKRTNDIIQRIAERSVIESTKGRWWLVIRSGDKHRDGDHKRLKRRHQDSRKRNRQSSTHRRRSIPSPNRNDKGDKRREKPIVPNRWMEPEKFDVKGSFATCVCQFEICSKYNCWNIEHKTAYLLW